MNVSKRGVRVGRTLVSITSSAPRIEGVELSRVHSAAEEFVNSACPSCASSFPFCVEPPKSASAPPGASDLGTRTDESHTHAIKQLTKYVCINYGGRIGWSWGMRALRREVVYWGFVKIRELLSLYASPKKYCNTNVTR
jgi:hypothetical protein